MITLGRLGAILATSSLVAAALAACSPAMDGAAIDASAGSTCADDGPRLPGTGLCRGRAVNYLDPQPENLGEQLDGCEWVMNETMFGEDDALLYLATQCGENVTTFEIQAGAHRADVVYVNSGVFGPSRAGETAIQLFTADAPNPMRALEAEIAALPSRRERRNCTIQPADTPGYPADALVIAPKTPPAGADEVYTACGPRGIDTGSTRYWRVRQGYAWFFDLGQDIVDFDPASITWMTRQADGTWVVAE